jgi:hypothetical protein
MRAIIIALSALGLIASSAPSIAAQCRDTKGKFIKCPTKAGTAPRCRDTKGHYAKCGTRGAKPV